VPELPEVEVVRRGLTDHFVGARVRDVIVRDSRSLRRNATGASGFIESMRGATPLAAVRRGKFLWLPLDSGEALVVHLGMSGQFRLPDGEPHRHERVRFALDDRPDLAFVDQRIFGGVALDAMVDVPDGRPAGLGSDSTSIPASVAHIARDVLDPALDEQTLIERLRTRSIATKVALLNQELVSGIGNIYADEALWAAGINGLVPASALTVDEWQALLAEVRAVMSRALDAGGTSFDALYVNVNGESGYFDVSLNAYGQSGKRCPRCGTPIVRVPWQNRSSHFCPNCQPAPAQREFAGDSREIIDECI
jgi:formamidopyrimidine-DNA glycosylase